MSHRSWDKPARTAQHNMTPPAPMPRPIASSPPDPQLYGSQVTAEHMKLLKALPIFRVHGDAGEAGIGEGGERRRRVAFASVSGGARELLMAPKHSNSALLGPEFAVEGSERDTQLLETLKVDRVGKGTFFREHVLPRWAEQDLPPGKCC